MPPRLTANSLSRLSRAGMCARSLGVRGRRGSGTSSLCSRMRSCCSCVFLPCMSRPLVRGSRPAALLFGIMTVMAIVLAAAAGNVAALALRIVAGRLLHFQRRLGVLMRRAGAALADCAGGLCGGRHRSSVLLIALVGRVLLDVPLPPLLLGVWVCGTGFVRACLGRLVVSGSFWTSIFRRGGRWFGHRVFPHDYLPVL